MTDRLIRRSRAVRRGALRQEDTVITEIDERMQLIAQNQKTIAELMDQIEADTRFVEEAMSAAKISEHDHAGLLAHWIETKTNASTEYDLAKLLKKLGQADFMKVVKAQAGEVKKFLSEREIGEVSTTTPGKKTGDKFEIIVPKTKTGKGGRK